MGRTHLLETGDGEFLRGGLGGMTGFVISIIFLLTLAAVLVALVRAFYRTVFRHRLRLELLRTLQNHPDWIAQDESLADLVNEAPTAAPSRSRISLHVVGLSLCILGLGCGGAGRSMGSGRVAVGLYLGGAICVWLGLLVILIGLVRYPAGLSTKES